MSEVILQRLDRIEAMLRQLLAGEKPDFDPTVSWTPAEFTEHKGKTFSACPVALLTELGGAYARFSEKSKQEGKKLKNEKDAWPWELKLSNTAKAWARYLGATAGDSDMPF
jgi:hypothetical protein